MSARPFERRAGSPGTRPETRYAVSGGYNIAYSVFGDGPVDFLIVSGMGWQIEHAWEEPSLARFLRKLGAFYRVIMFDKRGTGLSDSLGPDQAPSLEERVDDIKAVMDAAESRQVVVFGFSEGGPAALALGARHPERAHALILFATTARTPLASVYPSGIPHDVAEAMFSDWQRGWGTGYGLELLAPSVADDERMRQWWATCQRLTAGPGTIVASMRMLLDFDISAELPSIEAPALVMHAEGDALIPVAAARDIAAHVPNAQLQLLPGADHVYWLGDQNARLETIRTFLTALPAGAAITALRPRRGRARFGWESLTPAELDVVWLVGQGFTTPDIARRLYVSPRTVQTHLKHVFHKLGVSRRSEVAAEATRRLVAA